MEDYLKSPQKLTNKYRRRAKVAAWATGLSLIGGGLVDTANAYPAASSREEIQRSETTPQLFITNVDKQMAQIESRLKGLKGVRVINGKTLNSSPDVNIYFVAAPSTTNPRLYNLLEITVSGDQKIPLFSSISLGANSDKWGGTTNNPNGMILTQTNNPQDTMFTPGSIELWTNQGAAFRKYCVSTTNYDGNHPQFGESTGAAFSPTNPSVVSEQFEEFLQYTDEILEAN